MPRRVSSPPAMIRARPRLLFGRSLGGPVYFRAGPVYFRVGHAGLSCVFPGSLAHLSSARICFPRRSSFGQDVICFRLAAWGPVNSRTGPGLYLLQTTQGFLVAFPDVGQAPRVVWAVARRSSLFQGGSSLLSRRPLRFILLRKADQDSCH